MRITFPIESKTYTEYCMYCHSRDTLRAVRGKDGLQYECSKCNKTASRAIIMDPDLKWSIDSDKEYVHESVGVFIFNDQKEFLMFKLNKYPFGATIPAGHVDRDEDPEKAIHREVAEEVQLPIKKLAAVATVSIDKDGCRRGSDRHNWTIYCAVVASTQKPIVDEKEGSSPEWISLEDARKRTNCFAIDYILKNYFNEIISYSSNKMAPYSD